MMRSRLLSLAIHLGVIALLLMVSSYPTPHGKDSFRSMERRATRLIAPYVHRGGGGGGDRSTLRARRGNLPKAARQQLTPPSALPRETKAVLMMEPTLVMPPEVRMLTVDLAQLGDPLAPIGPPSNGRGSGGGIGDGRGGGVGDHVGPGVGPNDGGGVTTGVITGHLTAPAVLYRVDPEFSEEARKAKYQGTVVLTIEIGEDGKPRGFRVVRGLGLGLDEKAVEAVSRWKFRPAQRNGRPVPAPATIEVNFRLL